MKFKDKGTGSKNYLKLKSGESVRGVFRGDPYDFKQHWVEGRGVVCVGAGCGPCEEKRPSFRFRLNFIVNENGAYVAKVFEQGWTVYESLKALHEGDYNLEAHIMKVTRHGQGTDTTYSIVPVPNGALSKDQEKQIAAVKLIDLAHEVKEPGSDEDEESGEF